MTEETTQAVVDPTNAGAQPAAAEGNAQGSESIRAFLDEYEAGIKPQTPPVHEQPANNQPDILALQARLDRFESAKADEKHTADLADAVKTVKGDLGLEDWAVQGFIDAKARENKSVKDIWINRENNPAALKRLLASMNKELASQQRKGTVDTEATADRSAVAHAVRGASTKTPESAPPKLGSMNNTEFNAYLRENGIRNAV